jgi:hypothetical protein
LHFVAGRFRTRPQKDQVKDGNEAVTSRHSYATGGRGERGRGERGRGERGRGERGRGINITTQSNKTNHRYNRILTLILLTWRIG